MFIGSSRNCNKICQQNRRFNFDQKHNKHKHTILDLNQFKKDNEKYIQKIQYNWKQYEDKIKKYFKKLKQKLQKLQKQILNQLPQQQLKTSINSHDQKLIQLARNIFNQQFNLITCQEIDNFLDVKSKKQKNYFNQEYQYKQFLSSIIKKVKNTVQGLEPQLLQHQNKTDKYISKNQQKKYQSKIQKKQQNYKNQEKKNQKNKEQRHYFRDRDQHKQQNKQHKQDRKQQLRDNTPFEQTRRGQRQNKRENRQDRQQKYEKRNRQQRNQRRPQRDRDQKKTHQDREQKKPRQDKEQKRPFRQDRQQRRPNRQDRQQRRPNRQEKEQRRPNRQDRQQRRPNRQDRQQRAPRQDRQKRQNRVNRRDRQEKPHKKDAQHKESRVNNRREENEKKFVKVKIQNLKQSTDQFIIDLKMIQKIKSLRDRDLWKVVDNTGQINLLIPSHQSFKTGVQITLSNCYAKQYEGQLQILTKMYSKITSKAIGNNIDIGSFAKKDHRFKKYNKQSNPYPIIKIEKIQPDSENLKIIVKVISAKKDGQYINCVLGDETGIVNAQLQYTQLIKQNNSIYCRDLKVKINEPLGTILLVGGDRFLIENARDPVRKIKMQNNISKIQYKLQDQD